MICHSHNDCRATEKIQAVFYVFVINYDWTGALDYSKPIKFLISLCRIALFHFTLFGALFLVPETAAPVAHPSIHHWGFWGVFGS
jgi:hypothetical protein